MHEIYASALQRAAAGQAKERQLELADSFLALLKRRGHISLLPKILHVLKRGRNQEDMDATVTVAREEDYARYRKVIAQVLAQLEVSEFHMTVDPRIVGGYRVMGNGHLFDQTYRTKLIDLYKRLATASL
jgi:F0F1-type ATP synthase delta subunit